MNTTSWSLFPALAIAATFYCLSTGANSAQALTDQLAYSFVQDGFSEGATVAGSFTGSDLDGNGLLLHFPSSGGPPIANLELTSWSMRFSGNSLSPAFDLSLSELFGFVYEIGTAGIGDDPAFDPTLNANLTEGIGAIGASHFFTTGLGPNNFIGAYVGGQIDFGNLDDLADQALDSSDNLLLVTPVPEPAGVGSLAIAGVAVALTRKRVAHTA
jgi:hypothetical protein